MDRSNCLYYEISIIRLINESGQGVIIELRGASQAQSGLLILFALTFLAFSLSMPKLQNSLMKAVNSKTLPTDIQEQN